MSTCDGLKASKGYNYSPRGETMGQIYVHVFILIHVYVVVKDILKLPQDFPYFLNNKKSHQGAAKKIKIRAKK